MFTGLVEGIGRLAELKPMAGTYRLRIETALAGDLNPGDSLAVSGVCLTVILAEAGEVHVDIGPETARVTTFASWQRGQHVNLERAMRWDGRVGGHLVLGHVDGVGVVQDVRPDGESRWLTVGFPDDLAAYFIRKGSVAVDGISLTLAGLGDRQFDVQIIPHTWTNTTLGGIKLNDKVNLECDVVGKYVVRAMQVAGALRA